MDTILVTDASLRVALVIIRSLGRRGIRVIAAESSDIRPSRIIGFYSKYVYRKVLLPQHKDKEAYLEALSCLAKECDCIVPVHFDSVHLLSKNREIFKRSPILAPGAALLEEANDTSRIIKIAENLAIPVPKTYSIDNIDHLNKLTEQLHFPVIVKLKKEERFPPHLRYYIVNSKEELTDKFHKLHALQRFPLIQEYIKGEGVGFAALYDKDSRLRAYCCYRRIREYPITGGPSTFCETIYDEKLVSYGRRLLGALQWKGVAMVEFRREATTRKYYLMEVNPRFWGSLPLAIAAGIDFPYLFYLLSIGKDVGGMEKYKLEVKLRFLVMDAVSSLSYLKHNNVPAFFDFFKSLCDFRIKEGTLSLTDFMPNIPYLRKYVDYYLNG